MGGSSSSPGVEFHRIEKSNYTIDRYEYKWEIENFTSLTSGVGKPIESIPVQPRVGDQWKIVLENFTSLTSGEGKPIESIFAQLRVGEQWKIVLYPGGYNDRVKNFVSIWIKKNFELERIVKFSCSIMNADNSVFHTKSERKTLNMENCLGWATFCKRSLILRNENTVLSSGKLVLKCSLDIYEDKELLTAEVEDGDPYMENTYREVCENMETLLSDNAFSDYTIEVDGESILAHKAVLGARSRVFRTMITSETLGNSERVEMTDISKDALKQMLRFMYTGKTITLNFEMASELIYFADKYELFSLKRTCCKVLEANINADVAVKALILADRHSEKQLQDVVVRYIADNASEVKKRPDWVPLMTTRPDLADKIFEYLLLKGTTSSKNK